MTTALRGKGGRPGGAPTLQDVARIAGVSPATVSRALNTPGLVRPETVEQVTRAVAKTGYTPNLLAGGLAGGRTGLVAVVVPMLANSIFADLAQAITDTLDISGYQTLIGLSAYDAERADALLHAVVSRRPEGIILAGTDLSAIGRDRLAKAHVPVVQTWELTPDPVDMTVGVSHAAVGAAIGRHLLGRGLRRIALLSGGDRRAEVRFDALRAVLTEAGASPTPTVTAAGVSSMVFGRQGMARILDAGALPEVVVCSQDALAQGAMAEAQSRGMIIPDDVGVMGFGDVDFAAFMHPALTTVRIDRRAMGRTAAEALLARMRLGVAEEPAAKAIDVGFSIVDRASL